MRMQMSSSFVYRLFNKPPVISEREREREREREVSRDLINESLCGTVAG